MLKQNNQKGFAAFEVVLIVVALIAVGAAGYFAYQARQDKNDYSIDFPKKKIIKVSPTPVSPPVVAAQAATFTQISEQALLDSWMSDYLANNGTSSAYVTPAFKQTFSGGSFNGCRMHEPPTALKASYNNRSQKDSSHAIDSQVSWFTQGDQSVEGPFYEVSFVASGSKWLIDSIKYLNCGTRSP